MLQEVSGGPTSSSVGTSGGAGVFANYSGSGGNLIINNGHITGGNAGPDGTYPGSGGYGVLGLDGLILTNSGSIAGGLSLTTNIWAGGDGVIFANGTQNIINNSGSITGNNGINCQWGSGATITNTGGTVTGTVGAGIWNYGGTIDLINNTGTIVGATFGIYNSRVITILNNLQGQVGSISAPLTLYQNLPQNYGIILGSNASNYGQLAVTNANNWDANTLTLVNGTWKLVGSGQTNFSIFSGSIKSTIYSAVISGVSASLLNSSTLTGHYSGYSYSLVEESGTIGTTDVWDLLFSADVPLVSGPNAEDTQASLTNNLASLQGAFNLQTSIINNGLGYDCSLFDVHGLCISTGGRITNTNTPTGDSTSALVIGGYRVNDNVRVGAYLDQGISSSTPTGINLKQHNPLFGAFAVWQARQDGLGAQVKVAAGYNDSDMTVTRAVVGTSEAGSGSTSLISQAVSLVGSYGVEMQGSWIASPYVGIRYTDVKAGGYTEASSATVTAPLSYASLSQSTTSLLAGIRWSGKLTDRVGLNGSVGVEQDVSNNNSNYTATGVAGLTPIVFNTDINKTRPVASIGTTVSIDKRQQLAFSVFYSEQAFSNSSATSAYGTYTIGF